MKTDWNTILARLHADPLGIHRINHPCVDDELDQVQNILGKIPDELSNMLNHLNGAELFIQSGPFLTIFGIAPRRPLPPLEWTPDWYIDKFTPVWRSSRGCSSDWVIGMTNYGGLIVIDNVNVVKEWDTSQNLWRKSLHFSAWIEEMLLEGDAYLKELL